MRERIDKMVGYGLESIWVSTFHSTCVRILRRYIDRQLIICPQVALEKIVYVPDNARLKKSMKEKIRGHWVDFAICSPDLELICIAQLNIANDPSADFLPALQKIAKNAAVPLLVFESAYEYTPQMFSAINDLYHAGSYH